MALIVLHTDGLGSLATSLHERDVKVAERDPAVPGELTDATGVLLLDGPAEPDEALLAALRDAVAADVPVLAVGDAAGVLATALSGTVSDREVPEAAFVPIHRTAPGAEHDLSAGWPDGARGLVLHDREVTSLPDGADQLLLGSDGPSMWQVGSALGSPLLLHATAGMVATWLETERGQGLCEAAGVDPTDLAQEATRREKFTTAAGLSLLLRWVDDLS